jgi:hydrogenase expression/formation protein HypD
VFDVRDAFEWRGLGTVANSALEASGMPLPPSMPNGGSRSRKQSREVKSCECPAILRGVKKPTDCKLFGTVCTPDTPMGSCMVSSEGACAAYWTYGRFRTKAARSQKEAAA